MSIGFKMDGRIGRKEYLISSLMVTMLAVAASVAALSFALGDSHSDTPNVIAIVATLVSYVMQSALMVRRFHDLGKPGWHFWLTMIPFYNLYVGLILLFTHGAKGANQYGPEPAA